MATILFLCIVPHTNTNTQTHTAVLLKHNNKRKNKIFVEKKSPIWALHTQADYIKYRIGNDDIFFLLFFITYFSFSKHMFVCVCLWSHTFILYIECIIHTRLCMFAPFPHTCTHRQFCFFKQSKGDTTWSLAHTQTQPTYSYYIIYKIVFCCCCLSYASYIFSSRHCFYYNSRISCYLLACAPVPLWLLFVVIHSMAHNVWWRWLVYG